MAHPESWPQPSGLTTEGASLFATAFASAAKKDDDWWLRAEHQTAKLITSIQPIRLSEERRKAIANFVEHLIKGCLDCFVQVETFGSVPLKTYLPDGDIDLTALSVRTDLKETWAQDVLKALKRAEEDADAEFRVKEVQYIQAEVKIIKCLVENIVVDISFNQTGGLYTFFFLEEVDRYIGLNHLFKRSIILVKAWCYYESRILGAHHGLISTYALETLVLYIFHVFHSSLRGPLEVLYTFLVYFSNFDWDKYCVSLWGPLPLAPITQRMSADLAKPPRSDGGRLLLTQGFLEGCVKEYSGVSTGQDSNNQGRYFNTKYLNVLDPIRNTNNLGRSVNVGSFKRIRSAFGLGARTLGEVLDCSPDQINERFKSFFSCTFKSLERYRSGGRPDAASDNNTKQERARATTEASLVQPISGNLNIVNPEGQWRQVGGGKGRSEGDIARMQTKGSNHYYSPQEHLKKSIPVNRRSSEDHEHANTHPLFRTGESYQSRAPIQDSSSLWGSSRGRNNISDQSTLSLSNHDVGRPPGPSGHGNYKDPKQPQQRASVTSNASPGRSFPIGSTSLSESCPSPFPAAPPVQPGKFNPSPFETRECPQPYGPPTEESFSRLSIRGDERPGEEASPQLDEEAENRPPSSDVKAFDGGQLSRGHYSSSDEQCELEVVRSVDGHAAELRWHWPTQPSLEETSVGGRQQGEALSFPSPALSHHQEILPTTSLPSYHKSSAITLEPAVQAIIPCQSVQVPTQQAGAGTDLIPVLPISVGGVPGGGPCGPLHPPIIVEHASVLSPGPSFRNRLPMETASSLHVISLSPQPMCGSPPSLHMPGYSPYFVMPTGTDGVIRGGDSMGDLHSNGSVDFGSNLPLGSIQSLPDARVRANPQVAMSVVAEWPKGAAISPSNKMETTMSHGERIIISEDILFGDLKDQKKQLLRSFQESCMGFSNPNLVTMFPQGPQLWWEGGSGRSHKGNLNPHFGRLHVSHPHAGVVAGPAYSPRSRGVPDGMQQSWGFPIHGNNEDTGLPKARVGTGTYLPRHTYVSRERPGPGGRGGNQHGSYGHQDRNNLEESNQSHAPRYRSAGQGQGQQNKHEPRALKTPASELDKGSTCPQQQQQTMETRAPPPLKSSLPSPSTSETASTGLHIASSNGYPGVGIPNAPPVIMQQLVNDASTGFSPELEFGSLGPFQPG